MPTRPAPRLDRDKLVRDHLAFARGIARNLSWDTESGEEAIADAYLGLVQAAQRYDPAKGEFKAHAALRIAGEIRDGMRRRDRLHRRRSRPLGNLEPWALEPLSLQRVFTDADEDLEIQEPAAPTIDACRSLSFRQAVGRLADRDRQIIVLLDFGLNGREIARLLGVDDSRVCQLLRRIRKQLAAETADAA
jgi:RNA polymerase sigma factor (sigma-70 family)